MPVLHRKALRVLITAAIRAKLTHAPGSRLHITPRHPHIGRRILFTGLPRRRGETRDFPVGAADGLVVDGDAEHALKQVVEWGEPVHPGAPEVGQGLRGRKDAAEGDDEEEEERDEEGGEEFVGGETGDFVLERGSLVMGRCGGGNWGRGGDCVLLRELWGSGRSVEWRGGLEILTGLAEADVEQFKEHKGQVDVSTGETGRAVTKWGPPPTRVVDGAGEDRVRDFR